MTFQATRKIAAALADVFAAFEDVDRLKLWWGPAGFTNTFETFAFEPGGEWRFTMHGPDGKSYPNVQVVKDIDRPGRIVLQHTTQPPYVLTVSLDATDDAGTLVRWDQDFENPETERRMAHILAPANEQLLDRLAAEVLRIRQ